MPFEPGDKVGRYYIRRVLRRMDQGTGFVAEDDALKRNVFVVVANEPDRPEGMVNRGLRRSGRILASLNHAAFNKVYDFGYANERAYVVTELIETPLEHQVDQTGPWEPWRAARIVGTVAEAIDEMHRHGLVHTALTAGVGGLLFDATGKARVSALEWSVRAGRPLILVPDGAASGVAPELAQPGATASPLNDIWSLGLILLSLLSGVYELDAAQRYGRLLHELSGTVPDPLRELCARCLAVDPDDRPRNCIELMAVLDAFLGNVSPTRVFISHASADRAVVERDIVRTLETSGYSTWYAKNDIRSADDWERSILHGLKASDWFLIAVSAAARESDWVKDELFWAIEERPTRIIPVTVDTTAPRDLHIRLGRLQSVALRDVDAPRKILSILRGH